MNEKLSIKEVPFFASSFFIPLILFSLTGSSDIMFDDAAEFALVIKLGSIAHPPGTPAYVFFGIVWERVSAFLGVPTIISLTYFSSFCVSFATLFMFMTFRKIGMSINIADKKSLNTINLISLISSLVFATGSTTWAWSNTIEVYSFQVLAMSMVLLGLTMFHFNKANRHLILAGVGLAFGLSNHHVTMILFLPFIPLFFLKNLF